MLESEVASRNQVISDIEVKFTDYLRDYYQTVNSEVETLNGMLNKSTTEVREYQAELMVAAQDDEGSIRPIEELERRKNLAENVAQRIYDKGMIMRETYPTSERTLGEAFVYPLYRPDTKRLAPLIFLFGRSYSYVKRSGDCSSSKW